MDRSKPATVVPEQQPHSAVSSYKVVSYGRLGVSLANNPIVAVLVKVVALNLGLRTEDNDSIAVSGEIVPEHSQSARADEVEACSRAV